MKFFYGSAIQGCIDRYGRIFVHRTILDHFSALGVQAVTEHTACNSREAVIAELEKRFGPLPTDPIKRSEFIRAQMIASVEGEIDAAVFEVSVPSLGTGIEIAHAYLRPRMGLTPVPILMLYEKNYWPNQLSVMILGLKEERFSHLYVKEYSSLEEAKSLLTWFLTKVQCTQSEATAVESASSVPLL